MFCQLLCIPLFLPSRLLRSSIDRAGQAPLFLLILSPFIIPPHCFPFSFHPSNIHYTLQAMIFSLKPIPRWLTTLARSMMGLIVLALHIEFLSDESWTRWGHHTGLVLLRSTDFSPRRGAFSRMAGPGFACLFPARPSQLPILGLAVEGTAHIDGPTLG